MGVLSAVGDVRIYRDDPDSAFAEVRDLLHAPDVMFCQSESTYSDKGSSGSSGLRGASPRDLRGYPAFAGAGFEVVSMASNHTMDWGSDALVDGLERMRRDGIATIGAGKDIEEARSPAIVEADGTRIGFLGYCSVAPDSYYAVPGRAGIAPMRAITHYEAVENDQPGTPARIMTWPVQRDLEALLDDVQRLRDDVDLLVVSLHWGVHHIRGLLADYQQPVAHAALDAGADMILGHHPHILKAIEIYEGKPIFYSLGDFVKDFNVDRKPDPGWELELKQAYAPFHAAPTDRKERPKQYSIMARIQFDGSRVESVNFIPIFIEDAVTPRLVDVTSPEGAEIVDYQIDVTREAGFDTEFVIDDNQVNIKL